MDLWYIEEPKSSGAKYLILGLILGAALMLALQVSNSSAFSKEQSS